MGELDGLGNEQTKMDNHDFLVLSICSVDIIKRRDQNFLYTSCCSYHFFGDVF